MADLRRCIGSARFGIEAHDAPPEDFPVQPSRRDGLGALCRTHWTEYTGALRRARRERERDAAGTTVPRTSTPWPHPWWSRVDPSWYRRSERRPRVAIETPEGDAA